MTARDNKLLEFGSGNDRKWFRARKHLWSKTQFIKICKKHVKEFISIFRRKQRLLELKPGETIPERCCWQRESPQRCITNSSFGHFQTPYLVKTRNTYIYIYIAPKNYWIIMQWSLPRPYLLCPTTFHLKKIKKASIGCLQDPTDSKTTSEFNVCNSGQTRGTCSWIWLHGLDVSMFGRFFRCDKKEKRRCAVNVSP